MSSREELRRQLEEAQQTIDSLQEELDSTNHGLVTLTMELEQAREQYRQILNNVLEGIFQISPDGKRFIMANPALATMLGHNEPEDLTDRREISPEQIFEHPEEFHDIHHRLCNLEPVIRKEVKIRHRSDTPIWAMISIYPIHTGQDTSKHQDTGQEQEIGYFEGTLIDIDERKRSLQQLEETMSVFRKFVPDEFLQYLGRENVKDVRRGDKVKKTFTIMFTDIRSYATLSENMSADENFDFINDYIERVTPVIKKNRGFIDKFVGDAVMALFPVNPEDAIQAALDMQEAVIAFNHERKQEGRDPIEVGIGLNTGELMLGTVGDPERIQTTVISDHVNLASRIEDLTKQYHSPVLLSEFSLRQMDRPDLYNLRQLGKIKVKGKKEHIDVYEVIDGDNPQTAELKHRTREQFEEGLAKYFAGKYSSASLNFNAVLETNPDDKAARIYLTKAVQEMNRGLSDEETM